MRRTTLSGLFVGFVMLGAAGVLFASEADEFRQRAQALRKEAAAMGEQGKKDEAHRLKQEIKKLLHAAEERERQHKQQDQKHGHDAADEALRGLGQQLGDLLAKERKMRETKASEGDLAEVRNQIAKTEQELKKVQSIRAEHGKQHPEHQAFAEKLEAASRRVHHMRVAAENLKLADMPELSSQLSEKADATEREIHQAQQRMQAESRDAHPPRGDHAQEVVRELREEIERLRAEVKGLRQAIEKR
jgi:hypothetical protein